MTIIGAIDYSRCALRTRLVGVSSTREIFFDIFYRLDHGQTPMPGNHLQRFYDNQRSSQCQARNQEI